jgi:hypothetical protein
VLLTLLVQRLSDLVLLEGQPATKQRYAIPIVAAS